MESKVQSTLDRYEEASRQAGRIITRPRFSYEQRKTLDHTSRDRLLDQLQEFAPEDAAIPSRLQKN